MLKSAKRPRYLNLRFEEIRNSYLSERNRIIRRTSPMKNGEQPDIFDLWDVHVRVGSTLQRLSHVTPAGNQNRSFHNKSMFGLDITKFSRNFFGLSGRARKPFVITRTVSLWNNLVNRALEILLKSFTGRYITYKYFFFSEDLILNFNSPST